MHPILRVKYDAWTALDASCSWLRLPELLRRPFGTDELCSPSFGQRWQHVAAEQRELLEKLGKVKRPIELIEFLESLYGGSWRQLGEEYGRLQGELNALRESVASVREKRIDLYKRRNKLKDARRDAEATMGKHFREFIFEKSPSAEDVAERERLGSALQAVIQEQEVVREEIIKAFRNQREMAQNEAVRDAHQRRRNIEIEAELKRATIIREAVMASKGLDKANHRPSAWWFPLLSPDGLWFRATVDSAEAYLEPLC
jgi:chromosome segregation ATPase